MSSEREFRCGLSHHCRNEVKQGHIRYKEARKRGLEEAVNRPKLAFAVSPKYLSNETKIYIFITRIPRVVYVIFGGFFKNFIFPTSGRYLQTSALKLMLGKRELEFVLLYYWIKYNAACSYNSILDVICYFSDRSLHTRQR